MLIDWFTVTAQAFNFLILVWLLKRFLYQPILHAIDAREKRVATELANAAKKMTDAQLEHDEFTRKNEEFDQQRAALLSTATSEAQAERQRLLTEARTAADTLRKKQQETLRNEEHNLQQAISRRTQQEVFAIVRKALADLAGASLEERMIAAFTLRLRDLDDAAKELLTAAITASPSPVIVRSTFDLPPEHKATAEAAIRDTLGEAMPIRFETAPELISGIELITNGHKLGWSIAEYLTAMEQEVEALLRDRDKRGANAGLQQKPEHPAAAAENT